VNFAYLWTGYINIPVTGSYVFQTYSDDGSEVWLVVLARRLLHIAMPAPAP